MSERTLLHVEGMTCANCADTITRTLKKEGLRDVNVNYLTTEVTFEDVDAGRLEKIKSQIRSIGYGVASETTGPSSLAAAHDEHHGHAHATPVAKKFWLSATFTAPLLLKMLLPLPFLHEPFVQLALCLPVMWIGISFFGKSAWGSVKVKALNMDVLIFIGSVSAFVYSVTGMWLYDGTPMVHDYLFFETAASIISFVLLGNLLEQRSVRQTTSAIHELSKLQPLTAKKIIQSVNGPGNFLEIKSNEIEKGDMLFVGTGDKIPVDGIIINGHSIVSEAMITGESLPVTKSTGDKITGGTIVEDGSLEMKAEAVGNETTLAKIIRMVSDAQLSKPAIQRLGDRVSNIFVPAVLVISLVTFLVSFFLIGVGISGSIMRSIAVLVISCPCAMGLATPTALMVGIGRAARNGILIKGGSTVEQFAKVKTVVFDKTGTLTTGNFKVRKIETNGVTEEEVKMLLYALEQHSSHPVAKSILREFENERMAAADLKWKTISEDKGRGINATSTGGDIYSAGSFVMAKHCTADDTHSVYLLKNNALIATVDLEDEIKAGAKETISSLHAMGIKTIMVSGDRKAVCENVARQLNIDEVYSEQLPRQKSDLMERFTKENTTAMVGDGINDSPALAKADVGISLSDASQVAIQSAQVILLKSKDLRSLLLSHRFAKHTLLTIRQNLFWAFAYNVVAIPVAAAGFLSPAIGALSMAFSDAVLISNSVRLRFKKIN